MALRFEHEFTVPVPVEQAWPVLLDVKRVAPCLPGAALESVDGDDFTGTIKMKVGPITVSYHGSARFEKVDPETRTLTIKASGKEVRGQGTASAEVTARLLGEDGRTTVRVESSFNITGRPAQFSRGVLADVGGKLIDRFATNLAALLAQEEQRAQEGAQGAPATEEGPARAEETPAPGGSPAQGGAEAAARPPAPGAVRPAAAEAAPRPQEEALDLLELAGGPMLRRLAPVAAGVIAIILLVLSLRGLRRR